jgi:hypothetical protein
MQSKMPPTVMQKIRAELARDPKKSGIVGGLAVVLMFLLLRMEFSGPAAATASFIRRPEAAISESQAQFHRAASSNAVVDWLAQPRRQVERNLFAIHLEYYSRAADHIVSGDSSEDPGKSSSDATDQTRERRIPPENLPNQASQLKLQATVPGTDATALINGELVKVGDTVAGFTVVRIEARRVLVQQDGVTLEIEMP